MRNHGRRERQESSEESGSSEGDEAAPELRRKIKKERKARNESSLSVLTNKFIGMLEESPDGTIDLNDAVECLGVQKRRIYDITNVLEGIGYIQKFKKNKINLIDQQNDAGLDAEIRELEEEVQMLDATEADLTTRTAATATTIETLMHDPSQTQHAYILEKDLLDLLNVHKAIAPCLVIEASVDTKVDLYQPKPHNPAHSSVSTDLPEYQIIVRGERPLNLFFAHHND